MFKNMDAKKRQLAVQVIYAIGGSLLFALGVNLIIVPLGLYNGGFMGIAQLARTFLVSVLHLPGLMAALVVAAAQKCLRTGNSGDGKIFLTNVDHVIKVRTGEQDYDALQDDN